MKVELGDKAKDLVTGFEGICIARTQWLNGCVRVTLQSTELDKDKKPVDGVTFDEPQLKVTKAGAVRPGPVDTGGPIPTPRQHAGPSR